MALKYPIGMDDFKEIIEGGYVYVDKTDLIEEVLETAGKVQLIIRPRRFGKTINMSMLGYFFDLQSDNAGLFENLAVRNSRHYASLGAYPVVLLSFKDLKAPNFQVFLETFRAMMSRVFRDRQYLLESLDQFDKEDFACIAKKQGGEADLMGSLALLMQFLSKHHGKKVFLLIDEYDSPIHEAYAQGYYDEMVGFMRSFLGKALKGNLHLEKAVVTGILRVARESIFSDLNNIRVFSVLDQGFSDRFGFTEVETHQILESAGLTGESEVVRSWYNGYTMGDTVIYNPWSILNYMAEPEREFRLHWVNTSSNALIREQLLHAGPDIHDHLLRLLQGGSVETPVQEQTVFRDLAMDSQTLWSFFLFSGYLKVVNQTRKRDRWYYQLAIPNKEVALLFEEIIEGWLRRHYGADKVGPLLESLTSGDFHKFGVLLADLAQAVLSYYDTAGQPERVYHAFVLGLLVHLGERYEIRSNREAGLGRYDLMMRPRNLKDRGLVLEYKAADSPEDLDAALEAGLAQIQDRQYGRELEEAGVTVRSEIAVAFCGKQVGVKGREISSKPLHPSS